jgi:hypothetical protein
MDCGHASNLCADADDKIPKLLTNLTIQINTVSNALTKAQETATAFEDIEEDSQVRPRHGTIYPNVIARSC